MEKRRQLASSENRSRIGAQTNDKSHINAEMAVEKVEKEVLGCLIVARPGHGYFAGYHERFGSEDEVIHCKYGQRRS